MIELLHEVEEKMKAALDHLHQELRQLRTGRASLALLEGVTAEYYGTTTPLNQLATLAVADASLITIQPFDSSQIDALERGILKANLGLNPSNDGKLIRIPIPALTEDRRKELVRRAHDMAETTRNSIRQARREGNDAIKQLEGEKEISQDEEHRGYDEVQKLHDHYIAQAGETLATKEKDILAV